MPIRIEHQPSPYAVGLAGWQAGRGAAKQRQQKYVLDLWQQDRQNRYMEDRQDQRQQWMEGMANQRGVQQGWQAISAGLPEIPENASPEDRQRLQKLYQGMKKMGSGAFGMDENVVGQLGRTLDDINSILSGIPQMDIAEQTRRGMIWYNPNNPSEFSGKEVEGWTAAQAQGFDPSVIAAQQAQENERKAKQEAADQDKLAKEQLAAEQKEYDAAVAAANKWDDWYAAEGDKLYSDPLSPITEDSSKDEIDKLIRKRLGDKGRPTERPPIPPLRPGEKPHMGSPALGPALEPLTPEDEAAAGIAPSTSAPPARPIRIDPTTGKPAIVPAAPAVGGMVQPQASARPFETSATPVVGDWVGPQPAPEAPMQQLYEDSQRVFGEPFGYFPKPRGPLSPLSREQELEVNAALQRQRFGIYEEAEPPSGAPMPVVDDQAGGQSLDVGQAWRDMESTGAIPVTPGNEPIVDIQDEARKRYERTGGPPPQSGQNGPTGYDALPPAFRQRVRRAYEAGSPTTRAAIEERFPGIQPLPEEQQQMIVPPSTLRQHTEAQYGPRRGTGEGVPSDAERVIGKVEGSRSLRSRGYVAGLAEAERERRLTTPGANVTKYNLPPDEAAAERERAMNERYARAMAKKEERERLAASGQTVGEPPLYMGAGAGTGTPERRSVSSSSVDKQYRDLLGAPRRAEEQRRKDAARAAGIGRGMDRAKRLGKSSPAVAAAIQAALRGDVSAQRALEERGIQWRT